MIRLHTANEDAWEISREEIELGDKLGQGNYGVVFKGELTVTAMSPMIYAHKKEMNFEGKSHLTVAVKLLQRKCIHPTGACNYTIHCSSAVQGTYT